MFTHTHIADQFFHLTSKGASRMNVIVNIVLFASMCVSMGAIATYNLTNSDKPKVPNASLYLAMDNSKSQYQASQGMVNVKTDDRLLDIERNQAASADDRKLLHDQIYRLEEQQTREFNNINNKLNIDETQVKTVVLTLGTLITLSQAFLMFQHFASKRKKE